MRISSSWASTPGATAKLLWVRIAATVEPAFCSKGFASVFHKLSRCLKLVHILSNFDEESTDKGDAFRPTFSGPKRRQKGSPLVLSKPAPDSQANGTQGIIANPKLQLRRNSVILGALRLKLLLA